MWVESRSSDSTARAKDSSGAGSPWTRKTRLGGRSRMAPTQSSSSYLPAWAEKPPSVWIVALTGTSCPRMRTTFHPSTRRRPSVPGAW